LRAVLADKAVERVKKAFENTPFFIGENPFTG